MSLASPEGQAGPGPAGTRDALALLSADHQRILAAFADFALATSEAASAADRQGLLARVAMRLRAHTTIETEIFYPALRAAGLPGAMLDAAEHDHTAMVEELQALAATDSNAEALQELDGRLGQLHDAVRTHFDDEELRLFEAARGARLDLEALGVAMALRQGQLLGNEEGVD